MVLTEIVKCHSDLLKILSRRINQVQVKIYYSLEQALMDSLICFHLMEPKAKDGWILSQLSRGTIKPNLNQISILLTMIEVDLERDKLVELKR